MTVSLICSCKNRAHSLQVSLSSWLLFKEITEIIIVDWNSDETLDHLINLDSRIKIITVSDEKYFNQPQPLNLAASISSGEYILKVDTDYILNPYYNFFETYEIDQNSFLCGQNDYEEFEINSSPYFNHLRGLLYVSKDNYIKVGGYNEDIIKHYAYEDDEIVHRLELLGLKKKKICYNHNIIHIPHSDKKRLENFESYHTDKDLEDDIRQILSSNFNYSEEELEVQVEYQLTQKHIKINKQKSLSQSINYYHKSSTIWDISKINEQVYMAQKSKNKLKNLPISYYISLEESLDRQKNIQNEFLKYEVPLYGIISKRFSESDDIVTGRYIHQLNDGTKGCCVSHLKAIKHWYQNSDDEYGFFCEDDLSLETVDYWDFTWQEFVDSLPSDWDSVQLLTIREDFGDFKLRERQWNDWSVTAYILKREYAKKLIDTYIQGDTYCLDIPNTDIMPLIENIIFTTLGKTYTIPLFVEETNFNSTYSTEQDSDVKDGQKTNHYHSKKVVLDYWKNKKKEKTSMNISTNKLDLKDLLTEYSLDTENPIKNFNLGVWYETNGHTAPALSYYLRCAERSEDLDLAYESLIRGSFCYEKQGTRDGTSKSLMQQALCLLPSRPEAYFLLSRFSERREWWQDCYIYADWGLRFSDFNSKPFLTDVEYPGRYGLLFEKSLSGWWWGKDKESIEISLNLYNDPEISDDYKKTVKNNLERMGVEISSEPKNDNSKLSGMFDYIKYPTDKSDLGYLDNFYDNFFDSLRDKPITLMEIGASNGGSIKLWRDYLHEDTQIYACDINYFDHIPDTFSIIGDMYSTNRSSKFADDYFDVIIDDGPHTFESFVFLIQKYFSKIKSGGVLIIEHVTNMQWIESLSDLCTLIGYCSCELIDVSGKQKTPELLDRYDDGLYILKIKK